MGQDRLTERSYWDDHWERITLPAEVSRLDGTPLIAAEIDIFERFLPHRSLSILEIGGAPGQYLAYFYRHFGYTVSSLDYSPSGCEKTRENFKLLNIPGTVYQQDLFGDLSHLPQFDVVYSMGLVEHFEELSGVVGKHVELLRPGGLLVIGMPNLRGINRFFLERLAPDMLGNHNLDSMVVANWKGFEDEFKLETLFKGYVGGFEPMTFMVEEAEGKQVTRFAARMLNGLFHRRIKLFRKFNAPFFSGYIMGVYRKPAQ